MISRLLTAILLLCIYSSDIQAQTFLKGKVYEKVTDSLIYSVTISNITAKQTVLSERDGSYSIAASEGDKIIFSSIGYVSDTVIVNYSMLLTQYEPALALQSISLRRVIVTSSYQKDSLERRDYYKDIYNQPGITGRNGPANGVGVSISPLSFFSNRAKKQRQLKRRLIKDEQEDFIDYSFPAEWVERLTGLHDDSLRLFMYQYRPSYAFCRKTSREDMIIYISDKLKEFKRPRNQKT